jgi:hypothetical protein
MHRMVVTQGRIDELWGLACADAGYEPHVPMFIVASTASVDRGERNVYFDPGTQPDTRYVPLTDAELDQLRQAQGRHRVVVAADATEPQMLGLMRWGLENAPVRPQIPASSTSSPTPSARSAPSTARSAPAATSSAT